MSLTTRICFVWQTEQPTDGKPCRSRLFKIGNNECYLELEQFKRQTGALNYKISLIEQKKSVASQSSDSFKKVQRMKNYYSFGVLTYLRDTKSKRMQPILCCYKLFWRESPVIWCKDRRTILKSMPYLEKSGVLTIVCQIHLPVTATLPLQKISSQTSTYSTIHLEKLSQDLAKFLDENAMPDVDLRSGQCIFPAHRAVLSARSKIFSEEFDREMGENCLTVDIDTLVMEPFLKYIYSATVLDDLSWDVVPKLYAAARKYETHGLLRACSDFMAENIREDNFLEILVMADGSSNEELKKQVITFINKHGKLVMSEPWIKFSKEHEKLCNEIYQEIFVMACYRKH